MGQINASSTPASCPDNKEWLFSVKKWREGMHTPILCFAILQPVCAQDFPDPGDPKAEWEPEVCLQLWFALWSSAADTWVLGYCSPLQTPFANSK